MEAIGETKISSTFIWRRVHSLMGFWLVLYLILHLLTNSQAALWFGSEGSGFIRMVNTLESLPYLHAIEIVLIGIPMLVHIIWGVQRALTSRANAHPTTGHTPSLRYERNIAYSLQRLSSWILLIGIICHVVQMRFARMPESIMKGMEKQSIVKISSDPELYTLAPKLGVTLYNKEELKNAEWIQTSYSIRSNDVIAAAPTPGPAILLMVRDTFKSPLMAILYTIFVLAAAFHAFNGFWTFLITWGALLSYRSQKSMIPFCGVAAIGLALLGLAAIWGSYLL